MGNKFELNKGVLYSVLPLRDIVVFPHMIVPLFVGRPKSVLALEDVMQYERKILLVTQKNSAVEDPTIQDVYSVGVVATVLQMLKLPHGTVKVLVEGVQRANILRFNDDGPFLQAYAEPMDDTMIHDQTMEALCRTVVTEFEQYLKLNKKIPPEVLSSITQIDDPALLADTISSYMTLKIEEKQAILELETVASRLERLYSIMEGEVGILQVEKQIRTRVKSQMEKSQREYYLNEQMKAIQKELGNIDDDGKDEFTELEERIKATKLTKEAHEKAISELKKLRTMSPMAAEATVVRNYLDWLLSLPWSNLSPIKRNIKNAEKILNTEHYALEKVKERILEHLAVQSRVKKLSGPILCLVGPPGVGKTSLAQSIAKATGREFIRISLGGVRDESEIRGHRRTYIGSMPGKIIQGMKKAKKSNPLFLLDEIDKVGSDWRGDPSSALLEVLDPAQNAKFNDHYLEVDYDLSDVMFLATANTLNMPQPLLDRLEIIRLSGYTEDEKVEIAERHLLDRIQSKHGFKKGEFSIAIDAIRYVIQRYTRESGVRNLERELSKLARKVVKEILEKKTKTVKITPKNIEKYLGVPRYKYSEAEDDNMVGVTTGLAWTEVGGEILSIEAVVMPGKGNMIITGKLGEVMQESVRAAHSYVRSKCLQIGIIPPLYDKRDIHIHVPEGATPKDGPSAGIAMCTSIVSALTGIPVRKDVAMTGEITLRGRVLAIGGLKEKLLAAHRSGIKTVIIPEDNTKDLIDIPENIKKNLKIISVSNVDQVLPNALVSMPVPIEWKEEDDDPQDKVPLTKPFDDHITH